MSISHSPKGLCTIDTFLWNQTKLGKIELIVNLLIIVNVDLIQKLVSKQYVLIIKNTNKNYSPS